MSNPSSSMILKQRIAAALRGAFVADAASVGTHWIYDPAEMIKAVPSVDAPEFLDPPSPKYYSSQEFPGHYAKCGQLSPYGEQLLFVTEYVASSSSAKNDDEDNITDQAMSQSMLEWAESFGGRPDSALKQFVENMKSNDTSKHWPNCGADDDQAHIYMKIVPVTCRYAGSPKLLEKVTETIRVHQNNNKAVAFGIASARILEAVLLGAPSLAQALATVEENLDKDLLLSDDDNDNDVAAKQALLQDVKDAFVRAKMAGQETDKSLSDVLGDISHEIMKGKEDSPFYNIAARSCGLPGSFIGPLVLFYKSTLVGKETKEESLFVSAIRENILASGDTCSRGVFIGAVMAAAGTSTGDGDDSILPPEQWMGKMDEDIMTRVNAAVEKITQDIK